MTFAIVSKLKDNKKFINFSVPPDSFQELLDKYHSYDSGWCVWRHFHRRRLGKIRRLLSQHFAKDSVGVALDLGCGKGPVVVLLWELGVQGIYGVDYSHVEIATAKKLIAEAKIDNVKLYNQTIEKLPVADNFFDLIVCSEVLEHLSDPQAGIEIIERKLKNGGIAVISMPNLLSGYYLFGLISFFIKYKLLKMKPYPSEYERHLKHTYFSIRKMIVKHSGLNIIDRRGCYLYPFPAKLVKLLGVVFPKFIEYFDKLEDRFLSRHLPYFGGSSFFVVRKG